MDDGQRKRFRGVVIDMLFSILIVILIIFLVPWSLNGVIVKAFLVYIVVLVAFFMLAWLSLRRSDQQPEEEKHNSWRSFFYCAEDLQWLRDYKNHQDNVLYQRINFFALMLSIFIAGALSIENDPTAQGLFSVVGFILTCLWWMSVFRQYIVVEQIRKVLRNDGMYMKLREERERDDTSWYEWTFSGQKLLVHGVPLLFGVFWLVIMGVALSKFQVYSSPKEILIPVIFAGLTISLMAFFMVLKVSFTYIKGRPSKK